MERWQPLTVTPVAAESPAPTGIAEAEWQALERAFPDYGDAALEAAGLVIKGDGGKRYDRFRDRVLFPIHDSRGRVTQSQHAGNANRVSLNYLSGDLPYEQPGATDFRAKVFRYKLDGTEPWEEVYLSPTTLESGDVTQGKESGFRGMQTYAPAGQDPALFAGTFNEGVSNPVCRVLKFPSDFAPGGKPEEVVTDIARKELRSYRQLPVNFYQIQTKFRDEIRPRFGVMRAREFTMKDAYSFHLDDASLAEGYQAMYRAYTAIFERLQLKFRAVRADTGSIGGSASQEFHVLADSGEDAIAFSDGDDYAANLEMAEALAPATPRGAATVPLQKVATPKVRTIDDLTKFLGVTADKCMKTLLVEGDQGGAVAMIVRGDHELNAVKAQKLPGVASPLRMASVEAVLATAGCEPGFIGPVGLKCKVYMDRSAAHLSDFVCGANERDMHFTGANWGRDLPAGEIVDLRNVIAGDPSPTGKGTLGIARGIEVGHIFQLGRKYSEAMNATVLDEQG